MITAKQAYANHVRWKHYSPVEKFVHSVLEEEKIEERMLRCSKYEKRTFYIIDELLKKIFICDVEKYGEPITGWSADYSQVPSELEGKSVRDLVKELEQVYEFDPQISFVCKAFKALICELENVWGYKAELDVVNHILTISWDLSSAENT